MQSLIKTSIVFSIMLMGSLSPAFAHQPDISSTMLAENEQGEWILQIRAAMTAFEYEVHYMFGDKSYATPEEFEELVIKHVKDNFSAIGDDSIPLELTTGQVRLGHETSVYFQLPNMSSDVEQLEIINTTFADINRNQTALVFAPKGVKPIQLKLDSKNNHSTAIKRENETWSFTIARDNLSSMAGYLPYMIGGMSFLLSILWGTTRFKNKQSGSTYKNSLMMPT
jgi:hypothetical protein